MKQFVIALFAVFYFAANVSAQKFSVSFPDSLLKQPFSGNILLYLSKENKEPKNGTVGLDMFPCFRVNVKNIKPGAAVIIDDNAVSYPRPLSDLERTSYYVQAVWDRDLGSRSIGRGAGNLYSVSQKVAFTKDFNKIFKLAATKVNPEPVFKETQYVKELKVPSALLTNFSHRPITLDAAVVLPRQYFTEPQRKFPVRFTVSGYGGDYHRYSGNNNPAAPMDTTAVIVVNLDGNCRLGHSVYANSDNNGPWGDALTTEFIPQLERTYRCNGARLLNGHSSGGWTVLWLQTHYPNVFDACWSSSPDPVDFRSFLKVNLYEGQNMFYAKDSTLNQVGTVDGVFPWFSMRDTYALENVVYRGEQMHSIDAVFSERAANGEPMRIIDVKTGVVNPAVFDHWKNYDISLYLRTNWDKIKGNLDGKVRVTVGNQDNFLLNYAVMLLGDEMKKLNSAFIFKYYPGDHFTVSTPEYQKDGAQFLETKYHEWLEKRK
ncbi:MAG: alpha/beta hydrolase-fold protein [Mucilaginibacter sp.]